MTSKSSSPHSSNEEPPTPQTYEALLADSASWLELRELLKGPVRRAWDRLVMAERLLHLERLAYSETPEEAAFHRSIVKWLDQFIHRVEHDLEAVEIERAGGSSRERRRFKDGGTEYMAGDLQPEKPAT